MNTEKQNELINAVGANAPALYSGNDARIVDCTAKGKTAMIAVGEGVQREDISRAAQQANSAAAEHASRCVYLGLLAQGKKEYLDARGNYADNAARGDGFEAWAQEAVGGLMTLRTLQRYMALARAFLVDFEAVLGDVPGDIALLGDAVATWCGERTLAEIRRDICAEQRRKELKASPDAEPAEVAPGAPSAEDAKAETLLKFNKILDRVLERDNELRSAFEQAAPELNNAETTQYLEALAKHYSDLFGFYDRLAQKARRLGEEANANG